MGSESREGPDDSERREAYASWKQRLIEKGDASAFQETDFKPQRRAGASANRELPPRAFIVGESGEPALIHGNTVFGRIPDVDIRVNDTDVSRRHAEIRAAGSAYVIEDLGSTNGTLVNGVGVQSKFLEDGDRITIGPSSFTFVIDD
jgi:hypothetical protein